MGRQDCNLTTHPLAPNPDTKCSVRGCPQGKIQYLLSDDPNAPIRYNRLEYCPDRTFPNNRNDMPMSTNSGGVLDKCGFDNCVTIRAQDRGRPGVFHHFCELRELNIWKERWMVIYNT
jgi:hypothetical protein